MKVIYLNKETGKEVHYGENITFKKTGTLGSGYSYESVTTVPIINSTIPYLIEKGGLVQKEVKDRNDKKRSNKPQSELTVEEKLDMLATAVSMLLDHMKQLQTDFYGEKDVK